MSEERKSRYELFFEEEARKAQPTKRCSRCKKEKALTEYSPQKGRGFTSACKKCRRKPTKYRNPVDRFWKRLPTKTVKAENCTEWIGAYSSNSTPAPVCRWKGKVTTVRRVIYELTNGDLPDTMRVIPSCGNHRCVKQTHLKMLNAEEYDTFFRNHAAKGDSSAARRHPDRLNFNLYPELRPRGESHPSAKIKESDVHLIRAMAAEEKTASEIAQSLGIGQKIVRRVLSGETWAHVQ